MRILVLVLGLLFFAVPSWAICTTTTANLSQTTIQMAIDNAIDGDTICLPAGATTWTTTTALTPSVTLDKGITLQGKTSCNGSPVTCTDGTIIYDGTTATAGSDPLLITGRNARVTGISFKDQRALLDTGYRVSMDCSNCRFDHNSITQANTVQASKGVIAYSSPSSSQLIDHNYFKDLNGGINVYGEPAGVGQTYRGDTSWSTPVTMGDAFATYIETNVFNFATSVYNGSYDSYAGARVVFRYNWVIGTNSGGHGFDSGPTYRSTFRQEVYRNTVSNPRVDPIPLFFQTRGGIFYLWQNTVSASNGSYNKLFVITNYRSGDTTIGVAGIWGACNGTNIKDQNTPGRQGYACRDQVGRGPATDAANDWPKDTSSPKFSQPLFPAYSWGNTFKGHLMTSADMDVISGVLGNSEVRIKTLHVLANRDFYFEASSFDGKSGTGTGVLGSRPAACTTGVAYFATDQGSWNTSGNGDGSGVLYKCTATNTWTLAYTPYPYPHPLQAMQGNLKSPGVPKGLIVQ